MHVGAAKRINFPMYSNYEQKIRHSLYSLKVTQFSCLNEIEISKSKILITNIGGVWNSSKAINQNTDWIH